VIKTFVVNLARSRERRASAEAQLLAQSLPYCLVQAVDGRELTSAQLKTLADEYALRQTFPTAPVAGYVGCTLGHAAAWKAIIDSGDSAGLVVEDDFTFVEDCSAILSELEAIVHGAEIVLLNYGSFDYPCRLSSQATYRLDSNVFLAYPIDIESLNGGVGYLVTREASVRMLDALLPVRVLPDCWSYWHRAGCFDRLRCVVPAPIRARADFRSTMDHLHKSSFLGRFADLAATRKIFPLHQGVSAYRKYVISRGNRIKLVDEESPLAPII